MWKTESTGAARIENAVKQFLPPCQIRCPINEDIQRTNILISLLPEEPDLAKDGIIQVGDYLYEKNPFFTVCGYICGLCENDCNYRTRGGAIKRRLLKRFLSDTYTPYLAQKKALDIKKDKEKVAVIGGGPGGLMCAYELSRRGYNVTVFDASPKLGGAARYIPKYRLPEDVHDAVVDNLVRIAGIEVKLGTRVGEGSLTIQSLRDEGFKAFFVATGTPHIRPLTFGIERVDGQDLEGVTMGLTLLWEVNQGNIPPDYYKGKKVIVIGGGNVAFDVARTARRLGGDVTLVCLEIMDKTSKDAIPADDEEIEAGQEEGIRIVSGRGVRHILREGDKLKLDCPLCTSVFDDKGFNPQFECLDCLALEGDVVLPTIGQMADRSLLQTEGLLNEGGRLEVDHTTLRSQVPDIFIGGDVRAVGFLAEAMGEGVQAAESIDMYLSGVDLHRGRVKEYEPYGAPYRSSYKNEPEHTWLPADRRLNFDVFEEGFTLKEAIEEGKRCITCGPCISCKACVSVGVQEELAIAEVDEDLCSGCKTCVYVCNYEAAQLKIVGEKLVSWTDELKCKSCGMCVAACPAGARQLAGDKLQVRIDEVYATI
jgi:NADPH-dependent glutamate synthase beta subunit-like oxidoreductase/NAD-dependent dihydropyrimidine dehydrogenase PreA subunit